MNHSIEIPTISLVDLSFLDDDDPKSAQMIESLRHACTDIGFFYLKIEPDILPHELMLNVFD